MQNPQGTINPLRQALEQAFHPQPTVIGPGSQGGWGAQPGANPFVSQDERSSLADRTGIEPKVQPAQQTQAQPLQANQIANGSGIPDNIRAGIFKGEGTHGNLDTLFGHAEQNGPFAGIKISQMTVDQAINFARPGGEYMNWVAAHNNGVAATPMGAYQVVGSTLQKAKEGLGLKGNEIMDAATQDKIGTWIYKHQGTGAWAGYKGPAVYGDWGPEQLHVGSSRSGGGSPKSRQFAADNPALFEGRSIPNPAYASPAGAGGGGTGGDYNTALNVQRSQQRQRGGRGAPSSGTGPDAGGGGGGHKNQVNPDWQRYQARKNIDHLRALSPVATIQSLENIGKAIRSGASASA